MGQTQFTTGTANVRASCLLLARDRQCRLARRRRQYLPRPHQCAGSNRSRSRCYVVAALLRSGRRSVAALVPGVGSRLRLDEVAFPRQEVDGNAGHSEHPLVRRDVAAKGSGQSTQSGAGHVRHGTWRQHHYANAGSGARHREARTACGLRSLSHSVVGALRAQERDLSTACLHEFRDGWLAHGVEPLAAMGREDCRAGVRVEERLRHDVHAGA